MLVLVVGGSGLVGSVLTKRLLAQGHKVFSLSRHPVESKRNLVGLTGDILSPNLGMMAVPGKGFDAVYHLAGVVNLGADRHGLTWKTNVLGTRNCLNFAIRYGIPHFFFCSTAYFNGGHNTYERSKLLCEQMVQESDIPAKTIFRPSIIMPTDSTYSGHFFQLISLIVRAHHRADTIRRYIEDQMRLPALRPLFRLPGDPDGTLNLIKIDDVAQAMADIKDEGNFWLVHDSPPNLATLVQWVGEVILLDFRIESHFKATPIEAALQRLGAAFMPYLQGDSFKSDLSSCAKIDKRYIQESVKRFLLRDKT